MKELRFLLFLLLFLTSSTPSLCGEKPEKSSFTPAEQAWLKTEPTLRFIYDPYWPPFEWRDEIGRYTGMVSDIYAKIAEMTGIRFEPVSTKDWAESMTAFKARKAELVSAVTKTPAREAFMRFTDHSLFKIPTVLLQRHDRPPLPENLTAAVKEKSVGVVKGYAVAEYLKRAYPGIGLVEFSTVRDGLDYLRSGKIDLFATNDATAAYFIHRQGFGDLFKAATLPYFVDLRIGLQPDTPDIVVSVLEKALASIPRRHFDAVYGKWTETEEVRPEKSARLRLGELLPLDVVMIVLGVLVFVILAGWYRYRERGALVLGVPLLVAALAVYGLALLVTAVALENAKSDRQTEIAQSLQTVLGVTHSSLREWFTSQRHHLNHVVNQTELLTPFFGRDDSTLSFGNEASDEIFLSLKAQMNEATGFLVIDRNGTILAASEPSLSHRTITFAPVLRKIEKAFTERYAFVSPVRIPEDRLGHLRHYYIFTPIVEPSSHRPIAVFATRLDPLPIFNIVRQGRIGKTGETYLMNSQLQMVSRSRFERQLKERGLLPVNETSFLHITLQHDGRPTRAAEATLRRESGFDVSGYPDYRGIPVLGAWMWDEMLDLAIIVEIDKKEAMASFNTLKTAIFAVVLGIVGLSLTLVFFIVWYARTTQRAIRTHKKAVDRKNEELEAISATIDQAIEERFSAMSRSAQKE